MANRAKKNAALREGYDSDTSYDPIGDASVTQRREPHETRHKVRSHVPSQHVPAETMAMVRLLMAEQRKVESEREEARRVADKERDECRRQEDIRKENLRVEREEARRDTEIERERDLRAERAAEADAAARKLAEQQAELAQKQFEQQVALLRVQAELGEEAARLHREELSSSKKRDRAIASIPCHREGDDADEFLLTAERRLEAGGAKEDGWIVIISSKLSGKVGSAWQDICDIIDDYRGAKDRLLKVCGYTPKLAAELFFGFRSDQSKGLTADQLYHRGLQLFRRLVAPHKVPEGAEFSIMRGWMCSIVPKKARAVLDARAVTNAADLIVI